MASSGCTTCPNVSCPWIFSISPKSPKPMPSVRCWCMRSAPWGSAPRKTCVIIFVRIRSPAGPCWLSWLKTERSRLLRFKAGHTRRSVCRTSRCRARSTPARCCRRSTHWSGSGRAPSGCSIFAIGWRFIRRSTNVYTAITCCRFCTTNVSPQGSICVPSVQPIVWRCMPCMKNRTVWTRRACRPWRTICASSPVGWGWRRFRSIASATAGCVWQKRWRAGDYLAAHLLQCLGNQERQLQRLVGVHPWVAMGVVTIRQAILGDRPGAADAFGDVLPGHLDVDAACVGAFGLMHLEELLDLAQNLREIASLVTAAGLDGVAMHRVRTPQHLATFTLDGANQLRQMIADLVRTHARNQVQATRVIVRVENIDQPDQVVGVHARPDLDADRIVHSAQKLDMRAVQLPGTVADPQHVRGAVVVVVGQAVTADKGFFVVEQQGFVGREEAGFAQLGRSVHAAGAHEGERFVDAVGELAVLFTQRRIGDEVQVPLMHLMQVGKAALGKGAQQVERGGGLVVGLHQTIRVWNAAFLVEADAVDDVAPVSRKRNAVDGFIVGRARLGELARHASDLDHRTACGKGHDHGHLQQHLEGVANLACGKLHEAFGAVAALQQKRAALGHFGKLATQLSGLAGKHQRRVAGQALFDPG
ncbi:Uncharacterized protein ALO52_05173 [Pseudomonas syringae pv. primulae]|uniref:Uncharacterized protein n=1 Tax=Pseudomonas syringae pv. primulae TaxID=251707 RepID=A0A0P9YVJ5_9PSED|nr:Uncharacterized protein ALO52_05173 [Pseudomonas syringae pv. primulae]